MSDATLALGERLFEKYGAFTVFFARFVFGMRIITGPLAGVLRMPWKKFLAFNFLGAAVWVSAISAAGYLFGRHWEQLVRNLKRVDLAVVLVLAVGGILVWVRNRQR